VRSRCLRAEEIVALSPIKYSRRLIGNVDDHPPQRTVKDNDTDVDHGYRLYPGRSRNDR